MPTMPTMPDVPDMSASPLAGAAARCRGVETRPSIPSPRTGR